MKALLKYGLLAIVLCLSLPSPAQQQDTSRKAVPLGIVTQNGDTVYNYVLKDFVVTESDSAYRAKYNRYLSYVTWTYPYARMAKQMLEEYNKDLDSITGKRASKSYVNEAYEELKEKFSNGIRTLTQNQGKVLMKLIYRETGVTAYEIADTYLGSFRAMMWQTIARAGGANLKITYDPASGDDRVIEEIVQKIERKEIFVPDEPFIPDDPHAYLKARKKQYKAWQAAQKKAGKEKKKISATTGKKTKVN